MNDKTLARQYDKLTIRERTALVINAAGRDDLAEAARLIDTAPRVTLDAPDCGRAVQHLSLLIAYHAICQLEGCGMFLLSAIYDDKKGNKKSRAKMQDGCLAIAWSILARADAWKIVCAELGLDPIGVLKMVGLLADSSGVFLMQTAEKIARDIAPTAEEVRAARKRYSEKDGNLRAAESIAAEYRAVLDSPGLRK